MNESTKENCLLRPRGPHPHLARDERGTATIEYLIILVTVTIGAAFAVIAIGPPLVEFFRARVMWLALPIP